MHSKFCKDGTPNQTFKHMIVVLHSQQILVDNSSPSRGITLSTIPHTESQCCQVDEEN